MYIPQIKTKIIIRLPEKETILNVLRWLNISNAPRRLEICGRTKEKIYTKFALSKCDVKRCKRLQSQEQRW